MDRKQSPSLTLIRLSLAQGNDNAQVKSETKAVQIFRGSSAPHHEQRRTPKLSEGAQS